MFRYKDRKISIIALIFLWKHSAGSLKQVGAGAGIGEKQN